MLGWCPSIRQGVAKPLEESCGRGRGVEVAPRDLLDPSGSSGDQNHSQSGIGGHDSGRQQRRNKALPHKLKDETGAHRLESNVAMDACGLEREVRRYAPGRALGKIHERFVGEIFQTKPLRCTYTVPRVTGPGGGSIL